MKRFLAAAVMIGCLQSTTIYAEEIRPSWNWWDNLCLVCSVAIKKAQIAQVITNDPNSYDAACHLQNANPWDGGCRCGEIYINPWANHCTKDKEIIFFDLRKYLQNPY